VGKAYTDTTGAPVMAPWTQTFNVTGQVVSETGPDGTSGSYQSVFTFDNAARLTADVFTSSAGGKTSRSYELNKNSDRTGLTVSAPGGGQTRAGTFNAASQLQSSTVTGSGAGSGSYAYDPYGRTTTLPGVDTTSAAAITYGWKINDRVDTETVAGDSGPVVTTVLDDPLDRRVSAVTPTATNDESALYVYGDASDSPASLSITKADGSMVSTRYTDSPAGGMSISAATTVADGDVLPPSWLSGVSSRSGSTRVDVQLSNPHGDVVATIPNTTNVTADQVSEVTTYAPFGTEQAGGIPATTYGWEGTSQRDTVNAASLITMGARLYNQTTGRFLTIDPIPGGNANPYMYPADPVNGEDLNGMWPWDRERRNNDIMQLTSDRRGRSIVIQRGYYGWKKPGEMGGVGYDKARHKHGIWNLATMNLVLKTKRITYSHGTTWKYRKKVYEVVDGELTGRSVVIRAVVDFRWDKRSGRTGFMGQKGLITMFCENPSRADMCPSYVNNPRR
jgi:RHS repeat-associated protein